MSDRAASGVTVRPVDTIDAAPIAELSSTAQREIADLRGGASLLAERASLLDLAGAGTDACPANRLVAVAEYHGAVIGLVVVRLEERPPLGRVAVIEALYVDPGAREIGAGEGLLDEVLRWAHDHGCCEIDADALPGDRATKNFFESAGLVARKIVVSRRIERRQHVAEKGD